MEELIANNDFTQFSEKITDFINSEDEKSLTRIITAACKIKDDRWIRCLHSVFRGDPWPTQTVLTEIIRNDNNALLKFVFPFLEENFGRRPATIRLLDTCIKLSALDCCIYCLIHFDCIYHHDLNILFRKVFPRDNEEPHVFDRKKQCITILMEKYNTLTFVNEDGVPFEFGKMYKEIINLMKPRHTQTFFDSPQRLDAYKYFGTERLDLNVTFFRIQDMIHHCSEYRRGDVVKVIVENLMLPRGVEIPYDISPSACNQCVLMFGKIKCLMNNIKFYSLIILVNRGYLAPIKKTPNEQATKMVKIASRLPLEVLVNMYGGHLVIRDVNIFHEIRRLLLSSS